MPTVPIASLRRLTAAIFVRLGAPADLADEVGEVLADNHLAGHDSHGILRIPQYVAAIRAGELIPTARPEVLRDTATTAVVSGNWAFGQVAANFAVDIAAEKAREAGVAAVALVKVGHTGRLAAFTERAAKRNVAMFMSIGTVNKPITAPFGGRAPVFGTNPVAFTMPNGDGPPVTLDYATSAIAHGKIKVAQAKNEQLPPNSVLTRDGLPTTDPEEFAQGGFLLPFGAHKGYALAVIAEIMSGALTGADDFVEGSEATGAFLFAISSDAFRSKESYQKRLNAIVERIHAVPPAEGFDQVLLPGEPEARMRERRAREGVPIPERTWQEVSALAAEVGVAKEELTTGS